ncbi:MAG: glycosyltransferase, partial [Phycisphaerales bacterium]|nr:glycosyltransferase [Phycisphaerales bacterium]
MKFLMDVIYGVGMVLVLPVLVVKSWRTGKYRTGWAGRLGCGEKVLAERGEGVKVLLVHCVSVGELLSVRTLVEELLAADGWLEVVISTGTDTGTARAQAIYREYPRVYPVRYPLDFSFAVKRLFDRVRPNGVVLVELETWPNFLAVAKERGIPVAIVNGRISERSFPRYRWIRPVMAAMLRRVDWIGAQTETIAKRFVALGAAAERVRVLATLKYDNAKMAENVAGQEAMAAAMGLQGREQLLVAGSTGPGEEEAVLEAYVGLRGKYPRLRLAIVPRHPEVVAQVVRAIERRGLKAVRRTERPDGWVNRSEPRPLGSDREKSKLEIRNSKQAQSSKLETAHEQGDGGDNGDSVSNFEHLNLEFDSNFEFRTSNSSSLPDGRGSDEVFVLDTMGELRKLYALAFCVFVGRSLVKRGGGGGEMVGVAGWGRAWCFGRRRTNVGEG